MTPSLLNRFAACLCLLLVGLNAQAQSEQKFADLGDFRLESGQVIKNCRIGYRTHGLLNEERTNAVLFPTWFGGTTKDLGSQIGGGALLDTAGLYIITADALGNGVSSSPSNSKDQPGAKFPAFSIRDMVETQHRLVTEVLKIKRLRAVVGISMGGMQAFQWMISHPELVERVIPIVGTPKQTSQDLLLWKSQLRTIQDHGGSKEQVERGMRAVARIHALHLWTPAFHVARTKPDEVEKLLDGQEQGALSKSADDWASQLQAMIGHDVFKNFANEDEAVNFIKAKALIIVVSTDMMVNPTPSLKLAEKLKAKTLTLTNNAGHLGVSPELDRVITAVRDFIY